MHSWRIGQDCTATARVLVAQEILDDFVAALRAAASATTTGAPSQEADFGPLNNSNQIARVQGPLERLPDRAKIETSGHTVGSSGFFPEPTAVSGLIQTDEIIQSKIFGPVITVQKFKDEQEALHYANDIKYGLASSVWSRDDGTAMRMARSVAFGEA